VVQAGWRDEYGFHLKSVGMRAQAAACPEMSLTGL